MDGAAQARALRAGSASSPTAGPAVLVATHDVEFAARLAVPGRAARRRRADRRRPGRRDPLRRLVLRHRGRADPRRAPARSRPRQGAARLTGARSRRSSRGRWWAAMSWQVGGLRRARAGRWSAASGGTSARAPSARLVALVAALAALAVAGRLVLAPIPNVVATTDIALITGYALGAGARVRGRRAGGADLQHLARAGTVDGLGDGGLGAGRPRRRLARGAHPAAGSAGSAWRRLRARRASPTARCSTSR